MNAIARDLRPDAGSSSPAGDVLARMARGLGCAPAAPAALTARAVLAPLAGGGRLGVADCAWAAGAATVPHRHDAQDELLVVLEGEVELTVEGRARRHGPGAFALVPRGALHGLRALAPARTVSILSWDPLGPLA